MLFVCAYCAPFMSISLIFCHITPLALCTNLQFRTSRPIADLNVTTAAFVDDVEHDDAAAEEVQGGGEEETSSDEMLKHLEAQAREMQVRPRGEGPERKARMHISCC